MTVDVSRKIKQIQDTDYGKAPHSR